MTRSRYFTVKCVDSSGHRCWSSAWTDFSIGSTMEANEYVANWAHFESS
jgi:hypothetical protein